MSAHWVVTVIEDSLEGEIGEREIRIVAQTEKNEYPPDDEVFEAAKHFFGRNEQRRSVESKASFHPDKATSSKMASVPAFTCGSSKFWNASEVFAEL